MEDVGIYGMITPGTILFCVGVAGFVSSLIWLLAGIAGRKKREEKLARKAMAGSAAFRRADSPVRSAASPNSATERVQTQGAETEIITESFTEGLTEGTDCNPFPTQ